MARKRVKTVGKPIAPFDKVRRPGRSPAAIVDARVRETADFMARGYSTERLVQTLTAKYNVSHETVRDWMRKVRAEWHAIAGEVIKDRFEYCFNLWQTALNTARDAKDRTAEAKAIKGITDLLGANKAGETHAAAVAAAVAAQGHSIDVMGLTSGQIRAYLLDLKRDQ